MKQGCFADDLTIWRTGDDIDDNTSTLQQGLNVISTWSKEYKMPLSKGKTEAIMFSNYYGNREKISNLVLTIDEDPVKFKKEVKLLGVVLDDTLLFDTHTKNTTKKANYRNSQMR